MVCNHPVMGFSWPVRVRVACVCARFDQAAHQVGGVIVICALQQRSNPFDAHACVNRLVWQIDTGSICKLFVLHKD